MNVLGVRKETLDTVGAVSAETAEQMAAGVAKALGADIGVGITGIAGPGGGTEDKPAVWSISACGTTESSSRARPIPPSAATASECRRRARRSI